MLLFHYSQGGLGIVRRKQSHCGQNIRSVYPDIGLLGTQGCGLHGAKECEPGDIFRFLGVDQAAAGDHDLLHFGQVLQKKLGLILTNYTNIVRLKTQKRLQNLELIPTSSTYYQ